MLVIAVQETLLNAVGSIHIGVRVFHQLAGCLDHATYREGPVIHQERAPRHPGIRSEQQTGQAVRNDGPVHAPVEVVLRESCPVLEAEGIEAEILGIGQTHLHRFIFTPVRPLHIGCPTPGIVIAGHHGGILQRPEPFGHCPVGVAVGPPGPTTVVKGLRQLQAAHVEGGGTSLLRIHRGQPHIVDDRHHHRHGNGQGRAHDVERAEQAVLFQQLPGLLEVEFGIHSITSLVSGCSCSCSCSCR